MDWNEYLNLIKWFNIPASYNSYYHWSSILSLFLNSGISISTINPLLHIQQTSSFCIFRILPLCFPYYIQTFFNEFIEKSIVILCIIVVFCYVCTFLSWSIFMHRRLVIFTFEQNQILLNCSVVWVWISIP